MVLLKCQLSPFSRLKLPLSMKRTKLYINDSATDLKGLAHQTPFLRPSKGRRSPRIRAAYDSAQDLAAQDQSPSYTTWNDRTNAFVKASTLPLLLLTAPQLWMNFLNLRSGNLAALSALSWMAYLTGLGGNTLLLSYFTSKNENNAVLIQALGIAGNFAVLTQLRIAGCIPQLAYAVIAAVVAATATLTGLKISGHLDASKMGQRMWAAWQAVLGLVGLAVVPQVLCATVGVTSFLPSIVTLSAGLIILAMDLLGHLPSQLKDLWTRVSAWTATLLFMLQPVAQIVKNFTDPSSLSGLSLQTLQLAMAGNGLMLPRALFTNDLIWFTGSLWGSMCFGWAQMLSLYLAGLVSPVAMAITTLTAVVWFGFVLSKDAAAKGHSHPVKSLLGLFKN